MGILLLPTTYSPLPLIDNISDHHNFYKGMNQRILSPLRLQLQMETIRGFPRNVKEFFNSTNRKTIHRFIYVTEILLMSLRYTKLPNNIYINWRLKRVKHIN